MLALVIAVCIGTITVVGTSTNTTYRTAKNAMPGGS
jgi:hypothetical protein